MSATHPPAGDPLAGPQDPEHDPTAAYALEPAYALALTARVAASSGRTEPTRSPLHDAPLAHVPQSAPGDVADAFARARRAQRAWAQAPVAERCAVLHRLHDLVLDSLEEILDLVVLESGKARKDAFEEACHVALTARYYARTAARHLAPRRAGGLVPGLTHAELRQVPKGVVGVIAPWNYPFTLAVSDGLPALAAGNAVVVKPDARTMLTALLAARLLEEAGLPDGLWQVVAGPGPEIGPEVVAHADQVCFTGSTATGRVVARACADRLVGASLELGGKNPLLVLRDADLDRAAEGAVRAAFSNAGQLCVSSERLFVADQVYDRFVDRLVSRTEALTLGTSGEWGVDVGSLVGPEQLAAVSAHVEDARAQGARVLTGGRPRPDLGPNVYEPTVLEGVTPRMRCFGEETFGPVVSLYRFHDEGEAVDRANEGEYGLNASIWSRDTRRARALAARIRCGTVNVNEGYGATFGSLELPMGGMGSSGVGRRQGAEGIHRYTEAQAVATQRLLPLAPTLGLGDEAYARVMTTALRVMNRLGRA
jgi:succinate-semialdehyde dehydrogenase/glutarate-semialdehyde dehydrogenase